ncbi:MAG: excinuclease ABC subunit UvrA, partial [Candidatus Ranarchaeia archaeon]
MVKESIVIKGACQHNLKSIDLVLPRNKLIVFTGVSGSGKSSLAFDTIYAEGQRRYIESLSAYARQFLERMDKPDVEYIEGLSPAISIEQKTVSKNPRSTVGTVTEIYDYLRLLFARVGDPYCPSCGKRIQKQTPQQIVEQILKRPMGSNIVILAPVVKSRKGEYRKLIKDIKKQGFVRVRVDGKIYHVEDDIVLEKYVIHDIEIIVDRLVLKKGSQLKSRLNDSVETALRLGQGLIIIQDMDTGEVSKFSESLACPDCGINIPELEPRMFSFNNPYGACPECTGLGSKLEFDPELIIVDKNLSINEGAIMGKIPSPSSWTQRYREALAEHYGFDLDVPVKDLPAKALEVLLYGSGEERIKFRYKGQGDDAWTWESYRPSRGLIASLRNRFKYTKSDSAREFYMQFMSKIECGTCKGKRLRPESLAVRVAGKTIDKIVQMSIEQAYSFFKNIRLSKRKRMISHEILKEINQRLRFLMDVGLSYLTLDRAANTLSGGESQRIHLATQIGSRLVGVLYVLDEPSIGLHQRDKHRLIETLKELRDLGNTIIVVEHDEDTIRSSDYIVDLGLGA